jgi:hypothetical protein
MNASACGGINVTKLCASGDKCYPVFNFVDEQFVTELYAYCAWFINLKCKKLRGPIDEFKKESIVKHKGWCYEDAKSTGLFYFRSKYSLDHHTFCQDLRIVRVMKLYSL